MKARTKPHLIDAVQWRGDNTNEVIDFFLPHDPHTTYAWGGSATEVFIHSAKFGYLPLKVGWWAVLTPLLGVSTMSDAAFLSSYDLVSEEEVA